MCLETCGKTPPFEFNEMQVCCDAEMLSELGGFVSRSNWFGRLDMEYVAFRAFAKVVVLNETDAKYLAVSF